ncbi:MAG: hypothetical protein WCR30_01200 [Clostridia bacterium]
MIVLRSMNQIYDKFVDFFGEFYTQKINFEEFIYNQISYENISSVFLNAPKIDKKKQELEDFCEMLFQIKESKPSICNFIKVLLSSENFVAIFHFLRRFIVGQFGNTKFCLSATGLSQQGRLFERFLEVALYADLKPAEFFPFVFACVGCEPSSVLFPWKEPAKMFLRAVLESDKEILEIFANKNDDIKKILETEMGLVYDSEISLDNVDETKFKTEENLKQNVHINNENVNEEVFANKQNFDLKDEKVDIKESSKQIIEENNEINNQIVNSEKIDNYAENLQLNEQDKPLNINDSVAFNAEKSFLISLGIHSIDQFVKRAEEEIEDNLKNVLGIEISPLNLKFVNGSKCSDKAVLLLCRIVKLNADNENLNSFNSFSQLFEIGSLQLFSKLLFEKLITKASIMEAKWAIRLVSIFADEETEAKAIDFVTKLKNEKSLKEAKYMLKCMFYAKKQKAISYMNDLIEKKNSWAISECGGK